MLPEQEVLVAARKVVDGGEGFEAALGVEGRGLKRERRQDHLPATAASRLPLGRIEEPRSQSLPPPRLFHPELANLAAAAPRVTADPGHDPAALVWTSWDLGIRDATAIWFAQVVGREIRIIDYYEASGVDLGHYVREIGARPYVYAGHIVPHDAQAKELGTGKSRLEVLESLRST